MSIIGSNILAGASGQTGGAAAYEIERSVRFSSSDSAYLSRTPGTAGDRRTFTWAGWVKRCSLSNYQPLFGAVSSTADHSSIFFDNAYENNALCVWTAFGGGFSTGINIKTAAIFRDPSAWYHIIVAVDTNQASLANAVKVWVNGVSQTMSGTYNSGINTYFNSTVVHGVGYMTAAGTYSYLDGYLADVHLLDGIAVTDPSSFGEFDTNGVWQPIDYAGSYGLVSVAEATGALPIYNTTGTYGTVKGSGTRTDTNSSSIVLAIPMDGANNGTTFTDESATIKGSGSPKSLTRFGDTKTVTAISKYYGSSGLFDGTGDYLSVAASADLQLGSSDFCFEFWWYPTSTGRQALYHGSIGTDWSIAIDYSSVSSQKLGIWASSNGTSWNMISSDSGGNGICNMTVPQNTWNHIAFTRGGNTFRVFLNGILDKEITASGTIIDRSGSAAGIGVWWSTGAMSQVTGYLQDFRIYKGVAKYTSNFSPVLSSNNSFKLNFSDNSTAAALGTDTSGNGNNWTVNNISIITGGPTSVAAASGALPVYNTTDTYGATKGTGTRTDSNSSSIVLAIPMDGANNGTTFTDESATIRGSGSAKTISRFGDTKTSTAQSKYYGSSGYFDGTGDYLTVDAGTDTGFGTADFTVEWHMYYTGPTSGFGGHILDLRGANNGAHVYYVNNGRIYWTNDNTVGDIDTGASVNASAWIHWAFARQSTTYRLYRNGIEVYSVANSQNIPANSPIYIANRFNNSGQLSGYIQDLRIYKGVAKYTSNFNPPSSTQNATIAAGNDSLVDSPTNYGTDTGAGGEVRGNYCTLNPLDKATTGGALSNGNLDYAATVASWDMVRATFGISSGKWYWEVSVNSTTYGITGIAQASVSLNNNFFHTGICYGYNANSGWKYEGSPYAALAYGATWNGSGDICGVAFNSDAGTLTFYKNGVSQGVAYTGLTGTFFPAHTSYPTGSATFNFGQRPFAYTAPSGFKALCTTNLPEPTIADGSTAFEVITYQGNGTTQTLPNTDPTTSPQEPLNFSPDLVWIKSRSATYDHQLGDTVRGVTNILHSNLTVAESTLNTITGTSSGGFTVSAASFIGTNANGQTFAAWCWNAGGTTDPSNEAGSITSQVRANASAGFSVITATTPASPTANYSVGHGLGIAPSMWIWKHRDAASSWQVWHTSLGTNRLQLNSTAAAGNFGYPVTAPTSSVIWLNDGPTAAWNSTIVLYAFAPVAGYSSFGSYTGNGSADGTFVYTGFRPRWILYKPSNRSGTDWVLWDTARNPYNIASNYLLANTSGAEGSVGIVDILSNGFKLRVTSTGNNGAGDQIIYAAFAEHPFQYARAR